MGCQVSVTMLVSKSYGAMAPYIRGGKTVKENSYLSDMQIRIGR